MKNVIFFCHKEEGYMKYATRINSFRRFDKDVLRALESIGTIDGVDYVDLNYPEHFSDCGVEAVRKKLEESGLRCNAINLRFRDEFINGEFGNRDRAVSEKAVRLCREAAGVCRELGGDQMIIWLGFDGFDYSFQIDYVECWDRLVKAFREVCENADVPVSIEYKPYEERVHAFIDSFGTTLSIVQEVGKENLGITLDFCHMLMKKENPAMAAAWLLAHKKLYNIHLNDGEGSMDDGLMVGTVNFWKTMEVMYYLKKYDFQGVVYFDTFPKREKAVEECAANVAMCRKIESMIDAYGMDRISDVIAQNDAVAVCGMMAEML